MGWLIVEDLLTVLALVFLPALALERDLHLVEGLRKRGVRAVYGDASAAGVLDAAGVRNAKLLVLALPDSFGARRALDLARQKNPDIDVVVRTHTDHEREYFEQHGVGRVVMGERELALGMTEYALRSLGLTEDHSRDVTESARDSRGAA